MLFRSFPLWFSHDGPKSSKSVPKPSKIPSLLSAHAGIYISELIGVRGSLERDSSSLRALGPGGGQISRVVHVSTRAAFGVLREIHVF